LLLSSLLIGLAPGTARSAPPNLVLVTIDTLRADHLPLYGYFRNTSPNLQSFAADALVFERVVAPMATTLPVHVSLFTSTYPARHGVLSNFRHFRRPFVGGDSLATVAQQLGGAGYATAAFTSASPLAPETGIDAGFQTYSAPPLSLTDEGSVHWRGDRVTDAALAWLADARPPFFLWLHLFDPHKPYSPPAEYDRFRDEAALRERLRERNVAPLLHAKVVDMTNRYDGEILFADAQVGRLLNALRARELFDDSVVVVTSDHGEGLMEHGVPAHGRLFNEELFVPLLMRWPGSPAGRVAHTVSLIDVLPTLRAQTELPLDDAGYDGVDALARERVSALAQRNVSQRERLRTYALVDRRWKYWHLNDAPDQLYDLEADPFETRNVIGEHSAIANAMRGELQRLVREGRRRPGLEVSPQVSDERKRDLEALGYTQ
jgi:arylsulfatase A-like enzyme